MLWRFPNQVRGWLSLDEGLALRDLAAGKTVLEIGSFCGLSTICMAQVAKVVHSVDWHRGDQGTGYGWTLPEFADNIRDYNLLDKVVIHCGTILAVAPFLRPGMFDLAFIDGAHDTPAVITDIMAAKQSLKPDGVIAFHDWDYPSVRAAVREMFAKGPENIADRMMWRRI